MARAKPINYDLSLYDLELGGAFTFQGNLKITLKITEPIKEILLNAHQLKVNSASISGNGISAQKASEILYVEKEVSQDEEADNEAVAGKRVSS